MEWMPIETAPKDTDVLVWYDHFADKYVEHEKSGRLTDYATWAEDGNFMDGAGWCVAKWQPRHWESTDEYGSGYYMPAFWFAKENDDYVRVVNPTHWIPLTKPLVQS